MTALATALVELTLIGIDIAPILMGAKQALTPEDYTFLEGEIASAHKRFDAAYDKRKQELGQG